MMSQIGPIEDIVPVLNTVGRIRAGHQVAVGSSGKKRPASLNRFRFTSQDRDLLEEIAGTYGGEVREWNEPKAPGRQWEVFSEASKIDVLLPPDPLDGPVMELWSGGGRLRRCNLKACEVQVDGPEGPEYQYRPSCLCDQEGARQCTLKMRLQVVLPGLVLAGAWRIDTGSENAARKIPGMVRMIQHLQVSGLPAGYLYTQEAEAYGGRRKYIEILLGLTSTPVELGLAAGGGGRPVVGGGVSPGLGAGGSVVPDVLELESGGAPVVDADSSSVGPRSGTGAAPTLNEVLDAAQSKKLKPSALVAALKGMGYEVTAVGDVVDNPEALMDLADWVHQT